VFHWKVLPSIVIGTIPFLSAPLSAQDPVGSIRGVVYDKDFEAPLALVTVRIPDLEREVTTTEEGDYVLRDVPPGTYVVRFLKEGYLSQALTAVVRSGRLTTLDVQLEGEFVEMDEFVVQDISLGAGTEAALLALRFESPALLDSISADLMSRAGASDAASAVRLVSGATVQDGKFAVIRGLPDRYVNSQMNGVRLPTADAERRAVELDQFPSTVIESIQISKTFTPDQQGDASGGAVDVRLKGLPEDRTFQIRAQLGLNSQASFRDDFLSYDGGGPGTFGGQGNDPQPVDDPLTFGQNEGQWTGAVGVSEISAPTDHKWSIAFGDGMRLDDGVRLGGFASLYYERDSSFNDDGINDNLWQENPGEALTPEYTQGAPTNNNPEDGDFLTRLFDVQEGSQQVQYGGLASVGIASDNHAVDLTYLYTKNVEDKATLAENTRGKEFYFPNYDVTDPNDPGNIAFGASPYLRTHTLEYTERTTSTLQLHGDHRLPYEISPESDSTWIRFLEPELDWTIARSTANFDQPDKRLFGAQWRPFLLPPALTTPFYAEFKPGATINLGNLQRTFKEIDEESMQYAIDVALPFDRGLDRDGEVKLGFFRDAADRTYEQDSYSNGTVSFASNSSGLDFGQFWTDLFPGDSGVNQITADLGDVDYDGEQRITAFYGMVDFPVVDGLNVVGGARFETTRIGIENTPDDPIAAQYFDEASGQFVQFGPAADTDFEQDNVLPAFSFSYEPVEEITFRGSWSKTVARQTFRELTPILQFEFLGGPLFIGNPDLGMSDVTNYDLRFDYRPYESALISLSWFYKDLEDAIEFVQRFTNFTFTTVRNYPEGFLTGWEFEVRQDLGHFFDSLEGLSVGGNATFIDSEVTLPDDEQQTFQALGVPMPTRDATGAPEHLFNVYLTYDLTDSGTQTALFYTIRGDTLVAGANDSGGNFVPSIYETQFGTLNFSVTQELGDGAALRFQAKNITNPEIQRVYRSEFVPGGDTTQRSFRRGIDFSFGLSFSF